MQSDTSIRPSSVSTPHDLYNDATCIIRSRASTSIEVRLRNPNLTKGPEKTTRGGE
jgi:hypothetical protein